MVTGIKRSIALFSSWNFFFLSYSFVATRSLWHLIPNITMNVFPRPLLYPNEAEKGQGTATQPQGTPQNDLFLTRPSIPKKFLWACLAHQQLLPYLGIQDNFQPPPCIGPPLLETRNPERLHQGHNEPTTFDRFRSAPPPVASQLFPVRETAMDAHCPVPSHTQRVVCPGTWRAEEKAFAMSQSKRPSCRQGAPKRWQDVYVHLEKVICCVEGISDYRWDRRRHGWVGAKGIVWDTEDLACYVLSGIPSFVVVVRPSRDGFPIELLWDEETSTFLGVDAVCEKTMQVYGEEMGELLLNPAISIIIQ